MRIALIASCICALAFVLAPGVGIVARADAAPSGRIPLERTIRIATAALEALQYLHDNGVVHRALTPECIMVTENDVVKLIDFGRASDALSRRLTYTNLADELDPSITFLPSRSPGGGAMAARTPSQWA